MWFSVVCTPIDNDIHNSGHNVDLYWTNIVVDKSTDTSKPHSICFLTQYAGSKACSSLDSSLLGLLWDLNSPRDCAS